MATLPRKFADRTPSGGMFAEIDQVMSWASAVMDALDAAVQAQAATIAALQASVSVYYGPIAGLPGANTLPPGTRAVITDALLPSLGLIVVGGGAVRVSVFTDGVGWRVG